MFGAVAAYVLIAFTFASLFGVLQQVQPHAFHASTVHAPVRAPRLGTLMYFSFTVLTSTGFGEITPVTRMARALIVIEQVLGVMYVAFLVARLANLYRNTGKETGRSRLTARSSGRLPAPAACGSAHAGAASRSRVDLEAARQSLGDEGRDIGLGEAAQQQVSLPRLDHRLDGGKRLLHLRHAVVDPGLMHLLRRMVVALVGGVQALVAGAHHQRRDAQHGAPLGARRRRQRALAADRPRRDGR